MALVYVGGTSGVGTTATYAVSLSGTLTGGIASSPSQDDIVVVFSGFGNTAAVEPTCTGNNSGAYGFVTGTTSYHQNDTWDAEFAGRFAIQGATVDTSLTIGRTANGAYGGATVVQVWRGVDTTTPFDVATTVSGAGNTSLINPIAITPTTAGAVILAGGTGTQTTAGSAFVVSSNMTGPSVTTFGNGTTSDTGTCIASHEWTSGAFDPNVVTGGTTSTSSAWRSMTLALRPAPPPTTDLTAGNINQANTSTTGTISQTHALSAGNVNQANTSTTGAASQTHVLSAGNVNQVNTTTSGTVELDLSVTLTAGHVNQVNTATTGAISQTHALSAGNVKQTNTSTTGAASQTHLLAAGNVTQANTATTGAVVQTHTLSAGNVNQANTSTSGAAVQANALTAGNVNQVNTATTGAASQTHVLSAGNVNQANTSTSGAVVQTHALSAGNVNQANTATTGAVVQTHALSAGNVNQVNTATSGAVDLTFTVNLSAGHVNQANTATSGAISQTHALSAGHVAQANTSSAAPISQTHVLMAAAVAVDHIASASAIVQTYLLAANSVSQANTSNDGAISLLVPDAFSANSRQRLGLPSMGGAARFSPTDLAAPATRLGQAAAASQAFGPTDLPDPSTRLGTPSLDHTTRIGATAL